MSARASVASGCAPRATRSNSGSWGHAVVDRLAEHLTAAGARAIPVSQPLDPAGMSDRWPADFARRR